MPSFLFSRDYDNNITAQTHTKIQITCLVLIGSHITKDAINTVIITQIIDAAGENVWSDDPAWNIFRKITSERNIPTATIARGIRTFTFVSALNEIPVASQ